LRQPRQEPALLAAYKSAPPQNRAIFETLVAAVDPDFSASLRNEPSK
jgi:hypothetical protein